MAENANTSNKISTESLSLTGKPALVQNSQGIFYGFLEKSDTRNGTALLRDSFKLSPDRHITFSQYLDFLSNEVSDRYWNIEEEIHNSKDPDMSPYDYVDEIGVLPNEITISDKSFKEHKRDLSITDYASDGVYMVQHRTSTHENSMHVQASAPLVSLSGVEAIVNISEKSIFHPGVLNVKKDLKENGLVGDNGVSLSEMFDIAEFYEYITPLITFGFASNDHSNVAMLLKAKLAGLSSEDFDSVVNGLKVVPSYRATESIEYIVNTMTLQVFNYNLSRWGVNSLNDVEKFEDLSEDVWRFYEALSEMPALVVNSEERLSLYTEKAQFDEQDQ